MRTFAIGDVQGCLAPLRRLLDRLRFDPANDRLLFTGDLVNRGPESLATLRFVRALGEAARTVLGNHDLHLIALAQGGNHKKADDTLDAILRAPDRDALLAWLRAQPLALADAASGVLVVHAGVAPQWTRADVLALSQEVQRALAGPDGPRFLARMYGDRPDRWDDALAGADRLRFVINCLTRMRYCTPDGRLDLSPKGPPGTQPAPLVPWFEAPGRRTAGDTIVCGHWSSIGRVRWQQARVWCLDSGCVWGGTLAALELGTNRLHREPCASSS